MKGQNGKSMYLPRKKYRPILTLGVRGATTVSENSAEEILRATRELLYVMVRVNGIREDDVASVYFTTTHDLDAVFPATAARQLGWLGAALICGNEMPVQGSLQQCVRIMLHWNTRKRQEEIHHVYLRDAQSLRPDRSNIPAVPAEELEAVLELAEAGLLKSRPWT